MDKQMEIINEMLEQIVGGKSASFATLTNDDKDSVGECIENCKFCCSSDGIGVKSGTVSGIRPRP